MQTRAAQFWQKSLQRVTLRFLLQHFRVNLQQEQVECFKYIVQKLANKFSWVHRDRRQTGLKLHSLAVKFLIKRQGYTKPWQTTLLAVSHIRHV